VRAFDSSRPMGEGLGVRAFDSSRPMGEGWGEGDPEHGGGLSHVDRNRCRRPAPPG
jgi:hypothetical protein